MEMPAVAIRRCFLGALVALTPLHQFSAAPADLGQTLRREAFHSSGSIFSLRLTFAQARYSFTYGSAGHYWHNEGVWKVEGETVLLTAQTCLDRPGGVEIPCSKSFGNGRCVLRPEANSLYETALLHCESASSTRVLLNTGEESRTCALSFASARIPPGVKRIWKGRPVITMGIAEGLTTTNVNIREEPSISAKEAPYFERYDEPARGYVPRGTKLKILARTPEKVAVGKYLNYWFLVTVGDTEEKWMFAEFVRH